MLKMRRFLVVLLFTGAVFTYGGGLIYPVEAEALQQETLTLTGYLSLLYGDPPPNSNLSPRTEILLTDSAGTLLAELVMDVNTARAFSGDLVEVTGEVLLSAQGDDTSVQTIIVESVQSPLQDAGAQSDASAASTGAQPFVNVLCQFPDVPTQTHDSAWYANLMRTTYPGLDHYWRQISYDNINLTGTTTIPNWVMMPHVRTYYVNDASGDANLNTLAQDCITAADSLVNFPQYVGINMMFNASLGCCAWGGEHRITIDGQNKAYRTTWMPYWIDVSVLAHEMGHGFGMPHSSGPSWDPPEDLNIYISNWDVMSNDWGSELEYVTNFGYIQPGTIAYHLDIAGWMPQNRISTVSFGQSTTVTLERLRLPGANGNSLMAKVLIGGSTVHFYTVEARMKDGYDFNTPGSAVIIHDVDTTRTGNAGHALVVDNDLNRDVNDAGAMWTVGETFTDSLNQISISVTASTATSFTVQITNNSTPQTFPDPPTNVQVINMTATGMTVTWQDNSFNESGFRVYYYVGNNLFSLLSTRPANTTSFTDTTIGTCGYERYYLVTSFVNTNPNANYVSPTGAAGATTPCQPTLTSPPNASEWSNGRPVLGWNAAGYTYLTYEIYLDTNNPPNTLFDTIESGTNAVSYQPSSPLPLGTYFWRVRGLDDYGGISEWSAIRSFLVASAPGAAPVQNFYTTGSPVLTWNRLSWAVSYEVRVDESTSVTGTPLFSAVVPASQLSATVTPALETGTYYMRVRGQQSNGTWGGWSAPISFTILLP